MNDNYFNRLLRQTATRVWLNNPTIEEVRLALAQGAVGCTTNPAYAGGLLGRAPDEVRPIVRETVRDLRDAPTGDVVNIVQRKLVARIAEAFQPMFEASDGDRGWVSIQGSPEADTDGESIWTATQANRAVAPNAVPKIPATVPGLVALDRALEMGWPAIVTEVFSMDQLEAVCERYMAALAATRVRPSLFVAVITGILGDYLKKIAQEQELNIAAHDLELAGVYVARRCAKLVADRRYPVTLLFGGARTTEDLTGLVGASHHATLNWTTFAEILSLEPPVKETIDSAPDPAIERALLDTFPDVWKAWELGRLRPEEFETFGPVLHFRSNFIVGWNSLGREVESQVAALADEPMGSGGKSVARRGRYQS